MIVLDASAVVEWALHTRIGDEVAERLRRASSLHAPQLIDIEVIQVVRRYWLGGEVSFERAERALEYLDQLDINRYDHPLLRSRIWQLRANLTAYDAAYVALAEALRAPLLTTDGRMARAPGHRASMDLLPVA